MISTRRCDASSNASRAAAATLEDLRKRWEAEAPERDSSEFPVVARLPLLAAYRAQDSSPDPEPQAD
jgi:hypothetical protein